MRPPDNMINSLISFVNSLIYTKVLTVIYKTQINPTISYLHEPGAKRFSLALDISEIFKPLIGDRLIFSLLNRNQITEQSFVNELNGLQLKKSAVQTIVEELDTRLQTTIKHRDLNKYVSYQYLMRLEIFKLIKHLTGEKEYTGFDYSVIPESIVEAFIERILVSKDEFRWYLRTGNNADSEFDPDDHIKIGAFTLTIDDAKKYIYSFSTRRRVYKWADLNVSVWI